MKAPTREQREPYAPPSMRTGTDQYGVRVEVVGMRNAMSVRTDAPRSIQGQLDDAAQDEHEQGGGNGQVQRIAHSSPCPDVSVLLS
ncbi:hypothetical protein G3N58_00965 [Paraburkholderia sp. Ac-20342]|uniref:hypothetical protein n=1 Tax=Paraburkholderia sp. Ac-20342 TaxID=2703889 RepID=UPI0019825E66|nr:hypothetical protein [Paraburkholderia sp. Ac-20342]MBN3845404.1 hypothetical protein [Paraburkholderia sp. Ac-20342]